MPKSKTLFKNAKNCLRKASQSSNSVITNPKGGESTLVHLSGYFTQDAKTTKKNCLVEASQSSNSVNTGPKGGGGKSTLAHFLHTSPKIEKRQKLPHRSLPELKLREYGPEGGKSALAHLLAISPKIKKCQKQKTPKTAS